MGVVYAARDTELARRVALKLVRPRSDVEMMEARLRREARAMARLSHPNVVPVFDIGTHDGQLFIAMGLVAGPTLRSWVTEPRPWRRVAVREGGPRARHRVCGGAAVGAGLRSGLCREPVNVGSPRRHLPPLCARRAAHGQRHRLPPFTGSLPNAECAPRCGGGE
jgi:hypothetical protein